MTYRKSDTADRSNDTRPHAGEAGGALDGVTRTETLADHLDPDRIGTELPEDWTVKPELQQTDRDPLVETVCFSRSLSDPQLVLRPADPARPTEDIEFYERPNHRKRRERTMTVDRLEEALRVAVNRVHQFDG